jgi:hypothetical protein
MTCLTGRMFLEVDSARAFEIEVFLIDLFSVAWGELVLYRRVACV